MEYARDACNLSITNEVEFVRKYIVDECERMTSGLENILKEEKFKFLNWERVYTDSHKEGHNLIEFRGEKISGALQFIESILQFDKIAEINDYIKKIETCNKIVQPILVKEIESIKNELEGLYPILTELQPKFEKLNNEFKIFEEMRNQLKLILIKSGVLNISNLNMTVLDEKFNAENPGYSEFKNLYDEIKKQYIALTAQIQSLETTLANIKKYNLTIETYFQNQNSSPDN